MFRIIKIHFHLTRVFPWKERVPWSGCSEYRCCVKDHAVHVLLNGMQRVHFNFIWLMAPIFGVHIKFTSIYKRKLGHDHVILLQSHRYFIAIFTFKNMFFTQLTEIKKIVHVRFQFMIIFAANRNIIVSSWSRFIDRKKAIYEPFQRHLLR